MPTDGVTIYKDEEIIFHAVPKTGYQVEQWEVNGKKDCRKLQNQSGRQNPCGQEYYRNRIL